MQSEPLPSEEARPEVGAKPRRGTLIAVAVVGVAIFAVLFLVGFLPRLSRESSLNARAMVEKARVPAVNVAIPKRLPATHELDLPGTLQALQETTIYARTNGYLKKWMVDIGDAVKAGQLLALIDTPEIDQQLEQARAALAQSEAAREQAKSNLELARTSLERVKGLAPSGVASQQDLDQRQAAFAVEQSNVRAADAQVNGSQANVRRLSDMKSFAQVTAPFSGRITSRSTEVGALVTAGNGADQALFRVAQFDPVRIFINTPQSFAPLISDGAKAEVKVREFSERKFEGTVARTARSLDRVSHTLLTEVHVPNHDGALLAGMYAQVKIAVTSERPVLVVPGPAVMITGSGPQVAVVGAGEVAHFQAVKLGVDYGGEIEIVNGLRGDERVIANPGERLIEGGRVEVAAAAK